jgi:arylsulfatase A-like enzyme
MSDSMQGRPSLVLITVDCLRADHVGFMGYPRPTTPFLDTLANESVVVSTAIVAGAPTYYSFPAIFASRYPLDLGRDVVGLAPGENSLASALKNAGYATAAFSAGNPYLSARFGYDQGFDIFRDFLEPVPTSDSGAATNGDLAFTTRLNRKLERWSQRSPWLGGIYDDLYFEYCQRIANSRPDSLDTLRRYPSADVLVNEATAWVSAVRDQPFFLWLHLMDPHAPYYPVEEALQLMGTNITPSRARYLNSYWNRGNLAPSRLQRHRDKIVELYDAGVRWVDVQLTRLADSLSRLGLWDNCLFVFTADHGEEFLDHGGRFHSPARVTDELIRVPLLLRVPAQKPLRTGNAPFSLLNLAPTLLDALGVKAPSGFEGQSYWPYLRDGSSWGEPVITECVSTATNPFHRRDRLGPRILAARDKRFKLVWELATEQELLFDLEQDPNECHPLPAHEGKDARQRLMLRAWHHLVQSQERMNQSLRCKSIAHELALEWAAGRKADHALTSCVAGR